MNKTKVKVAFDTSGISCPGSGERGIGRYAKYHLIESLRDSREFEITALVEDGVQTDKLQFLKEFPNLKCINSSQFSAKDFDLLHLPDPMSQSKGVTRLFEMADKLPVSVLFHDLIPLVQHGYHFDFYGSTLARDYLKRLDQISSDIKIIFTNSNSTGSDLTRVVGVKQDKLKTVYAGSSLNNTSKKSGWKETFGPFFLVVGGLDPHKGFSSTLKAYFQAQLENKCSIVVVGSVNDPYKQVYEQGLAKLGVKSIHFLGYVSESELTGLYDEALALLYPSIYEGFGFPVLEALSLGCPVVTTNSSSLPEVGGNAALYVTEDNYSNTLIRLYSDQGLRNDLKLAGQQQAHNFSWSKVASSVFEGWRSII